MKKILIFIFVIIFCNINAQNVTTSLREEILNGKIKIIKQKIYKDEKIDTMQYCFNDFGLLIHDVHYREQTFYYYNSNNQIIKSISYYLEYGGIESSSDEYIYEDGKLIKYILKYSPSTDKISRYIYHLFTNYKYDFNNQLVEVMEFSKNRKYKKETFLKHYKYQYDSCGNRKIEEEFNSKGEKVKMIEKKYVNNILLESFTWKKFEGEDLYLKSIYQYDENKNLEIHIEIVYMYGSKTDIALQSTTSYFYDDQQRLIKVIESRGNDRITTYSDFDKNDNWLQKLFIVNGKEEKTIREIEYFNK
jgi:hypothetical protein